MLDTDTKRRIDTARDILVGKVPDPKSQVEQITIALIYKFMDDMDNESREMGGEASFFAGDFEKFRWTNLIDTRLGGHERLNLYTEAISRLPQNPGMPQLFRDIFKNAFLPYRDPETLSLFLKTINEFRYDHSERLGDAFEYLLSVLGSQGDAGQFRTPRHIIDFMVQVLDPKKDETILDPACGTAGFLISSYKHIVAQNTKKTPGDLLTPSDRKRLVENFRGFDISPDMVRLSLVNMYLHQFANPQIFEYDTLTSEDRWNEHYDVILANPPFMSPKGGIKPHNKFSIPSNRSEVLFVDYIAEHLLPNGRAAIIVPEGIIFQTGSAHKSLRKMLVEGGFLWAVVSLPAGVFNPYSGVKTSILLLDKQLAKKTDKILFVKIENEGFDLGAQRKPTDFNDIPEVLNTLVSFQQAVIQGKDYLIKNAFVVDKAIIEKQKEWNLNYEIYRLNEAKNNCKYDFVSLGDETLFHIESGGTPSSEVPEYWNGDVNWVTLVDLPSQNFITELHKTERTITKLGLEKSSAKIIPPNSILVSSRATIGRIGINKVPLATNQGFKNIIIKDTSRVNVKFVAFMIAQLKEQMLQLASGGTFKEISKSSFSTLKIPLPSPSSQMQIVEEIEEYQRIINEARQQINTMENKIRDCISDVWGEELPEN